MKYNCMALPQTHTNTRQHPLLQAVPRLLAATGEVFIAYVKNQTTNKRLDMMCLKML